MKKSLFFMLLLALLAFGCGSKTQETVSTDSTTTVADTTADAPEKAKASNGPVLGFYVGDFEAVKFQKGKNPSFTNRINISLDAIVEDGSLSGHSVVAGNSRPFTGTYTKDEVGYHVEATEPGDDKYDGKFSFVIDLDGHTLQGTWVANDAKLAVTERKYDLNHKTFTYDANLALPHDIAWSELYGKVPEPDWQRAEVLTDEVVNVNASNTKLKKEDIENMRKGDLEVLRNSIYARHGYSFKTRKMRYIFDSAVKWYIPVSTDVSKELTQLEQDNIALIKRYEEHATAYYDEFGR